MSVSVCRFTVVEMLGNIVMFRVRFSDHTTIMRESQLVD